MKSKAIISLLKKILKLSKADILSVWLREDADNSVEFTAGLISHGKKHAAGENLIMQILFQEKKIRVINVQKDKKIKELPFIKANKVGSLIVLPIETGREKIGIILLYSRKIFTLNNNKLCELSKMVLCETIAIQNVYLKKQLRILGEAVNLDGLTKLYDHRSFHETLIQEVSKSQRFKYPVSVIMMDIDHFKKFNDTYGHLVGDKVLSIIADIVKKCIRAYDIAFRYGGEEISVICPHTSRRQAMTVGERIRKEVERYPFYAGITGENAKLTVSIGISSYPENAKSKHELVEKSDQALYLAKEEGRNRICSSLISTEKKIKFGFCPPAFTSPFYKSVLNGIREVIEDVGNVELIYDSPEKESDYKKHREIIDKFIKMRLDSIAVCSMEKKLLGKKIMECNKAGIEVFMFNNVEELPYGNVISYIGYKNREAGREVGRYLARLLRKKGKIAMLEGLKEITSNERKEGFLEIINNFKNIKVVTSINANWERNIARKVTEEILDKYPDIDAIFGVSDEMALGALDTVIDAGRQGEIFVIGLDGNPNAFHSIRDGDLTATMNTNAVGMGRTLMRTVLRSKIKGEKIEKRIWLPIMMVDLENVNQFL